MRSSSVSEVLSAGTGPKKELVRIVMVMASGQKKPPGISALAVFWELGVCLAGPVRQQAGEIKEKKEEPARHSLGFKHESPVLVQW